MAADLQIEISLRSFLFPAELLGRSGASENPMVALSERRAKRIKNQLVRRTWEAGLLLLATAILLDGLALLGNRSLLGLPASRPSAMWNSLHGPGLVLLALGLLRYHLLANDQSLHTKSLGEVQLLHLLQTPLGRNEYFLHHFLLFCRHYRVLFGLGALALVGLAVHPPWRIMPRGYAVLALLLNVTLLTWVGGAAQYVIEWRLFAGRKRGGLQRVISWQLSLGLAAACLALAWLPYRSFLRGQLVFWLFLTALFFLTSAWIVLIQGKNTYREATEILWSRFLRADPDRVLGKRYRAALGSFIAFWRIPPRLTPADRAAVARLRSVRHADRAWVFFTALAYTAAFSYFMATLWVWLKGYPAHRSADFDAAIRLLLARAPVVFMAVYSLESLNRATRAGPVRIDLFFAANARTVALLAAVVCLVGLTDAIVFGPAALTLGPRVGSLGFYLWSFLLSNVHLYLATMALWCWLLAIGVLVDHGADSMPARTVGRAALLFFFAFFHVFWYIPQIGASMLFTLLWDPLNLSTRFGSPSSLSINAPFILIGLLLTYLLLRWGFALLRRALVRANRSAAQTR